jgi:hypothetical protein
MNDLPGLPSTFSRGDLVSCGFAGWETWNALRGSGLAAVPLDPAVYVVYRPAISRPAFSDGNPGGRFKGKDPTVAVSELQRNWVVGTNVMYIGKANSARRRLTQFARFGAGDSKVGHWGGRYIWQLADYAEQLVAWHAISWGEEARAYEKRLFAHFAALHGGARPFANLTG